MLHLVSRCNRNKHARVGAAHASIKYLKLQRTADDSRGLSFPAFHTLGSISICSTVHPSFCLAIGLKMMDFEATSDQFDKVIPDGLNLLYDAGSGAKVE